MRYEPKEFKTLDEMASIDVGRLTEAQARTILEGIRWPDGIACPRCGSVKVKRLEAKSEKVRDGVIQCNDCKGQFTVTVGTVMHGSHITLRQWVQAFYSICSHKKGVSALQLQRNLGLHSYRSAWFLAHRIRLESGRSLCLLSPRTAQKGGRFVFRGGEGPVCGPPGKEASHRASWGLSGWQSIARAKMTPPGARRSEFARGVAGRGAP